MRGNQAGDDDPSGEISFLFLWVICFQGLGLADGADEILLDQKGAVEDDFAGGVHGYEGCMCVEHGWAGR